jgi:hypothetical protein
VRLARLGTTTAALAALLAPAAQAERVPSLRDSRAAVVVCRPDSPRLIRRSFGPGRRRAAALRLARGCARHAIGPAVRAGARIVVLPGVYRERVVIRAPGVRIEGAGRRARDVVVRGEVDADRADGLVLSGLTVERGAAADVRVARTDGFRVHRVVARGSSGDGIAAARSDHGLLDRVEAYAAGGAALRVGPGPRGRCGAGHGIEVRDAHAYRSVIGYAGTSGDAVWIHRSRFDGNATGMSVDAFAAGPATPRGCLRIEHDVITRNGAAAFFAADHLAACRAGAAGLVCPRVATPAGTGLLLRGVNGAQVRGNLVAGNPRAGIELLWSPASARGVRDPRRQFDTSNGNRFVADRLQGNGTDVVWDREGAGNCWSGLPDLPPCPAGSVFGLGDAAVQARDVPCAGWDPAAAPVPIGCDWAQVPR